MNSHGSNPIAAYMNADLTGDATPSTLTGLSFLWLEVTSKCNLECLHCYADSGPRADLLGRMSTEDWLAVIREAADVGCRQVQFIGGEPTLHPDLARMIEFASACGHTFVEVFTNAATLGEDLLRTFVRFGVHVVTSFYSDDPAVHDRITKRRGSFVRSVAGIKRIVAAGLPVRAGIIETGDNVGHALRARRFLEGLGVRDIKVDFQRGVGRGAQRAGEEEPMSPLCGECWKGKLCITATGRAYPCVFSRFAEVGSIEVGVRGIVSGEPLSEFRAALREYRRNAESKGGGLSLEAGDCGPDTRCRPTCSPCGPAEFSEPCGPCEPTCSPCQPVHFCVPERMCAPDLRCGPTVRPLSPEDSWRTHRRGAGLLTPRHRPPGCEFVGSETSS